MRLRPLVAELEGATTVEAWKDALRAVQRKYPLLSVRIAKTPRERPFFTYAADTQVPFRIVPLAEPCTIDEEMGRAIEAVVRGRRSSPDAGHLVPCAGALCGAPRLASRGVRREDEPDGAARPHRRGGR
jgi:hypothetical protein